MKVRTEYHNLIFEEMQLCFKDTGTIISEPEGTSSVCQSNLAWLSPLETVDPDCLSLNPDSTSYATILKIIQLLCASVSTSKKQ